MCFELKKMLLIYSFLPSFLPSFKGKKEEIKGETREARELNLTNNNNFLIS